ncbi:MAG: hypothetical protein NVSMB19_19500 [Vulcanimicrobiaceae bacterium]
MRCDEVRPDAEERENRYQERDDFVVTQRELCEFQVTMASDERDPRSVARDGEEKVKKK